MTTLDITVDVTEAIGTGEPAHTVATAHLPADGSSPEVVCFAFPGGGYNRSYYSLGLVDDGPGQAQWHTARGWVFVACDHLQVGDSTVLDPDITTYEMIAAANAETVRHVLARLADGSLSDTIGPVTDPAVLGLGQSMGGCFTVVTQAHHRVFDGIGLLGFSGIHTVVRSKPGFPDVTMPVMARSGYPQAPVMFNEAEVMAAAAVVADDASLAEAVVDAEHAWTWQFHHEDEPSDVVARDMAAMSGGDVPPWRSASTPACAILMVSPGTVATEAASIDVPVLVAVGERDVVPDPWSEPRAFPGSSDISVFVCERMAHMHNFAPTRERFWSRIHSWGNRVAGQARRGDPS